MSWTRPARPDWMDEATYAQIPEELTVRELRVTVDQPGFRVNELVLVTTLLDAEGVREAGGRATVPSNAGTSSWISARSRMS